jgi:hypothetical protein
LNQKKVVFPLRGSRRTRCCPTNFCCAHVFDCGSYALIRHINSSRQPNDTVLWGFHFPYKFADYPATKKVQALIFKFFAKKIPKILPIQKKALPL